VVVRGKNIPHPLLLLQYLLLFKWYIRTSNLRSSEVIYIPRHGGGTFLKGTICHFFRGSGINSWNLQTRNFCRQRNWRTVLVQLEVPTGTKIIHTRQLSRGQPRPDIDSAPYSCF
jgi:hypothetical protein